MNSKSRQKQIFENLNSTIIKLFPESSTNRVFRLICGTFSCLHLYFALHGYANFNHLLPYIKWDGIPEVMRRNSEWRDQTLKEIT